MKNFIYSVTIGFVLISQTVHAQWIRCGKSIDSFYSFTSFPNKATGGANLFAGSNSSGVYLSTDDGTSWTVNSKSLSFGSVRGLAAIDTIVFSSGYTISISNDIAKSWTRSTAGNIDPSAFTIMGGVVFAGTYVSGIYKSSNTGKSWTAVNSGLKDSALWITAISHSDTSLFAGTWGRGVYRSTNNGASWTEANNGIVNHIHAFAVVPNEVGGTNLFVGTFFGEGVYLSTNKGENWTPLSNGLTNKNIRCLAVSPNAVGGVNLFAGTWKGGVFLSTDNGAHWSSFNTGMTSTTVNALYVSGSYLFAGTDNGIWRRPLADLMTNVEQLNIENTDGGFGLDQNYPNPFNSSTKISYQIPTTGTVSLKVYDTLGKEVSTLVNGKKRAGIYEVVFDAHGLTAGTYFYNLRVGTSAEIKKMILLK